MPKRRRDTNRKRTAGLTMGLKSSYTPERRNQSRNAMREGRKSARESECRCSLDVVDGFIEVLSSITNLRPSSVMETRREPPFTFRQEKPIRSMRHILGPLRI